MWYKAEKNNWRKFQTQDCQPQILKDGCKPFVDNCTEKKDNPRFAYPKATTIDKLKTYLAKPKSNKYRPSPNNWIQISKIWVKKCCQRYPQCKHDDRFWRQYFYSTRLLLTLCHHVFIIESTLSVLGNIWTVNKLSISVNLNYLINMSFHKVFSNDHLVQTILHFLQSDDMKNATLVCR